MPTERQRCHGIGHDGAVTGSHAGNGSTLHGAAEAHEDRVKDAEGQEHAARDQNRV